MTSNGAINLTPVAHERITKFVLETEPEEFDLNTDKVIKRLERLVRACIAEYKPSRQRQSDTFARRKQMADEGKSFHEIAELEQVNYNSIAIYFRDTPALKQYYTDRKKGRKRKEYAPFIKAWNDGADTLAVARQFNMTPASVATTLNKLRSRYYPLRRVHTSGKERAPL